MSSMAEASVGNVEKSSDSSVSSPNNNDSFNSESSSFIRTQHNLSTYPGPGRGRRKRCSTFDMSSVHQHNLLETMKLNFKKGSPMMLSHDMLGELLDLILTAKEVSAKQTKLYLNNQISDFHQNNGKHISQESIHNTLITFGTLSMPENAKIITRNKKRSVKEVSHHFDMNKHENLDLSFFNKVFPQTHINVLGSALENLRSWNFDIFDLYETLGSDHVLTMQYVGISCLSRFRLFDILPIDRNIVWEYLGNIAREYKLVPYHNALHGVDVMQTMYSTLSNNIKMTSKLSNASVFAILIAAAVHDVGHPARNNQFLVTTEHRLSKVYHDQSVLENYHIARSMELMVTEKWSLLAGFSKVDASDIRALMIKSILHTDMAKHADIVRNLTLDLDHVNHGLDATLAKNHTRCLSLLLHAADVSNPSKPWKSYRKWTDKIMEEFRAQYKDEEKLGIKHGFFDPEKPVPEFQIGFIQFVVSPLFSQIDQIHGIQMERALFHLKRNLQAWKMQVVNREIVVAKGRIDSNHYVKQKLLRRSASVQ
eukprot:g5633.t1